MSEIDGLDALNRRLAAISDTRRLLGRIALGAVAEAKRTVPRKTGNLGRTIRLGTVTDTSAEIIAGGLYGVGYARYVEEGTRPHDIYPRRKKVLRFGTTPGSVRLTGTVRTGATEGVVFARHVRHPGTKAQPYLMPAAQKAAAEQGTMAIVVAWNEAA